MSRRKTFKEFHKQYDETFLLSTPHANYSLGDFCEIERRFFLHVENESIIDELDFPDEERLKYQEYLGNVSKTDAGFPQISIEKQLMVDIKLSIPTPSVDPGLKLNREKMVSYVFDNVKARLLDNKGTLPMRKILDEKIEELDRKGLKSLKKEVGRLKRTYIIDTLYYADFVSVNVKKGFGLSVQAEAKIKGIVGVEMKSKIESSGEHSYSFSGESNVPFAAKIISLDEL